CVAGARAAGAGGADGADLAKAVADEAERIEQEVLEADRRLSAAGAQLLPRNAAVYTHCNTGALATGGIGTALGILREAWRAGRLRHVWVGETRPVLQGARLTAWELLQDRIPATLVVDAAAGLLFRRGEVDAVVVGADRVAANGDVANKIGTYTLAVLAWRHGVPMYVAAPWSSVDLSTADGSGIPIEERSPDEVRGAAGVRWAPPEVPAWNPAFDVTPAELVTAIVTDRGVARPPLPVSLRELERGGARCST
ncbi:MAG: S-methyl-5-thioribose-1-phosphate isomerase, partial [Clostridia bacterium]|nr:S-methyl-5-thioribose-1-phosphate isomerase [Clostridia bacterium]